MRAEDFRASEIITRGGVRGFPLFAASRNILIGARTIGLIQADLFRSLGQARAAGVLAHHGYEAGLATATALTNLYDWDSKEEVVRAGVEVLGAVGLAAIEVDRFDDFGDEAAFVLSGVWRGSIEADQWLARNDPVSVPICHFLAGCVSGYIGACIGREVLARETSCRACGDAECRFEARPLEAWGIAQGHQRRSSEATSFDQEVSRLQSQLARAWKEVERQRVEIERLRVDRTDATPSGRIIFRSPAMAQVVALAEKVASTDSTVLMIGPSGTGKEVLARHIHARSGRGDKPFLAVNCAALPPNLLESELFGHVRGAFTGADTDKRGLFVEAGRGTLFLDEVGELPFQPQAKLLRALQEREVRPVGGVRDVPVEARIIAATNSDLGEMVVQGRFRTDLYYRLAVIPIRLPPLSDRRQDILPLARHVLSRMSPGHAGLRPQVVRRLTAYSWPGNVRELENTIEYALALAGDEPIGPEHLPLTLFQVNQDPLVELAADLPTMEELTRRYYKLVLEHTGGRRAKAASILGVHPSTIWRRLQYNGITS